MTEHTTHGRLVALDDVLGALAEGGPLSGDELARELGLARLDARMALVDAHAHGLLRTTPRGDWEISEVGREALETGVIHEPRRRPRRVWPARLRPGYLGRRGLPLAVALAVSAGGVAVASGGLPSFSGPPVIASTHSKARSHRRRRHIVRTARSEYVRRETRGRRYLERYTVVPRARRLGEQRVLESRRTASPACREGADVAGRRLRGTAAETPQAKRTSDIILRGACSVPRGSASVWAARRRR